LETSAEDVEGFTSPVHRVDFGCGFSFGVGVGVHVHVHVRRLQVNQHHRRGMGIPLVVLGMGYPSSFVRSGREGGRAEGYTRRGGRLAEGSGDDDEEEEGE
jgi:hypothetical protein